MVSGHAPRWLGATLDLVFPPVCAACEVELDGSLRGLLCTACREQLVDAQASCPRCGSTMRESDAARGCLRCRERRFYFQRVVRLGGYEGALRAAVLRIKNVRQRALAVALGDLLGERLAIDLAEFRADAVVPVPMHWSRRVWRGVNSPQTLGQRLAKRLSVPLADQLLQRCRSTAPQAALSPTRRLANVRGAFRARRHRDLAGARLVLIDDIMTTGATVNEAAKVLCKAGADSVWVVVLARAEGLL